MKQENQTKATKYAVCFCVATFIAFCVIWIYGFFTQDAARNIRVLADAFSVSGTLFLLFAGMMFVSGEGALIGIGFVLRNVVQAFVPMGRRWHEKYADYRERKLSENKKRNSSSILVTGLVFLFIGIVFTVYLYVRYYNI